jgi:hypothetical protein
MLTELGSEYTDVGVFDLSKMQPYSLEHLYKSFISISKHLILYLPRTSDLNQIAKYAPDDQKLEVTHYCIKGASKVCVSRLLMLLPGCICVDLIRLFVCILVTIAGPVQRMRGQPWWLKMRRMVRFKGV